MMNDESRERIMGLCQSRLAAFSLTSSIIRRITSRLAVQTAPQVVSVHGLNSWIFINKVTYGNGKIHRISVAVIASATVTCTNWTVFTYLLTYLLSSQLLRVAR